MRVELTVVTVADQKHWVDSQNMPGKFKYFLKRYNAREQTYEAGGAWQQDNGEEWIHTAGTSDKIYKYGSPQQSASDGWMLD